MLSCLNDLLSNNYTTEVDYKFIKPVGSKNEIMYVFTSKFLIEMNSPLSRPKPISYRYFNLKYCKKIYIDFTAIHG